MFPYQVFRLVVKRDYKTALDVSLPRSMDFDSTHPRDPSPNCVMQIARRVISLHSHNNFMDGRDLPRF
jgi:hypothetical protein